MRRRIIGFDIKRFIKDNQEWLLFLLIFNIIAFISILCGVR